MSSISTLMIALALGLGMLVGSLALDLTLGAERASAHMEAIR